MDKGFIITDMVSFYVRWYAIYIVEVTLEFPMQKESWILFKEKRIKLSEERKEMGRQEKWSKEEEDTERGGTTESEKGGGVFANHLDSVSDKTHLVSKHLITQPAPSFFSRSCVN